MGERNISDYQVTSMLNIWIRIIQKCAEAWLVFLLKLFNFMKFILNLEPSKIPLNLEPSKLLSICSPLNSSQFRAPLNPFQFCIEDKATCCPPIIRPLASLLREYCEAQVLQFAHTRRPLNQLIEFPAECNWEGMAN